MNFLTTFYQGEQKYNTATVRIVFKGRWIFFTISKFEHKYAIPYNMIYLRKVRNSHASFLFFCQPFIKLRFLFFTNQCLLPKLINFYARELKIKRMLCSKLFSSLLTSAAINIAYSYAWKGCWTIILGTITRTSLNGSGNVGRPSKIYHFTKSTPNSPWLVYFNLALSISLNMYHTFV